MQRWQAEPVLDARAELGEGPVWDAELRRLLWVDIYPGRLHRFDPRTRADEVVPVGQSLSAVAPCRDGGLVLAVRRGFAVLDGEDARVIAPVNDHDADVRMNDGACDSRGRFWAGSMHTGDVPGAGALYRLDADGRATRMLDGVTISNGIGWSRDDTVMYYIDTPTNGVDAFDFDAAAGELSNRRRIVEIDPEDGFPDGLAVDAEGCIWVALWEGWSVRRYRPTGELIGVVDVPVARVTSCAFVGDELDELYITTAQLAAGDPRTARERQAGGLFRVRPGVRGLPAYSCELRG